MTYHFFGCPAARSTFRPIGHHQLPMVSLGLSTGPLLLGLDLCPADVRHRTMTGRIGA
jgi:hypothetical protein